MSSDNETGRLDFSKLNLHSFATLENATRVKCQGCNTSRRYWCGECARLLVPEGPCVNLPLKVHVLQSAAEFPQKSTAQHVQILAPDHGRVWRPFPNCLPEFYDQVIRDRPAGTVAILYPSEDALTLDESFVQLPSLDTLVVIDANWSKSVSIIGSAELSGLPRVKLCAQEGCADRQSRFWRYAPTRGSDSKMFNQEVVRGLLSTIEAIHSFCDSYASAKGASRGSCDNLLWLFAFNWYRVKEVYVAAPGKRDRIMRKSKGLMNDF
jgi:DTW domain